MTGRALAVCVVVAVAALTVAGSVDPSDPGSANFLLDVDNEEDVNVVYGPDTVEVPGGSIRVYASSTADDDGERLVAVGIELPLEILTSPELAWNISVGEECMPDPKTNERVCLPLLAPLELLYPDLPGLTGDGSPYIYQSIWWNPLGHQPLHVYGGSPDTAHFDLHFYIVAPEEVLQVAPGPCQSLAPDVFYAATAPVPELCWPAGSGFASIGATVPMMGNHLLNMAAPELAFRAKGGRPSGFNHTWVWGSYNGSITYMEPMITAAYLSSHPRECHAIPATPPRYTRPGWYPSAYCVDTDEDEGVQRIELRGFEHRDGDCAEASGGVYAADSFLHMPPDAPGPPLPEECEFAVS